MSYRELWVFIKHLPADSWTQTEIRDASNSELQELAAAEPDRAVKFGPWALTNYQLAKLADELAELRFAVVRTTPGNEDYPRPEPTPRPGMNRPRRVQSDANIRYLNSLRATG